MREDGIGITIMHELAVTALGDMTENNERNWKARVIVWKTGDLLKQEMSHLIIRDEDVPEDPRKEGGRVQIFCNWNWRIV